MKRSALLLGFSVATCALTMLGGERDAAACGGCFHPPTQTASDITDERMLLSVSQQQTTLYDQIQYTGNPTSFAWVLPIKGTVDVGLSADVLFDSIDALTATQISPPPISCPGLPADCSTPAYSAAGTAASADGGANDGVTVTKSQNVGPYETVQLHATDSSALNNWLTQNGFSIPAAVQPVVDAYVTEGFDFLAMKLLPGEGVQAMRPVRVTSQGASLSLPLRMASVGTGATTGITIWVVSDGRYEPQNFPFFHIEDADLVWDFSTSSSNYTTLRAQNEAALNGKGWEIESSLELNQQTITSTILSGGQVYNYGGGGVASGYAEDAGEDYLPVSNDSDGGAAADGGSTGETADQVRADDLTALFAGLNGPNARVTRMRSDISHAAMTTDFILQASADQSELTNIRIAAQSVNLTCPIYNNCQVVGQGTPAQAAAAAADGSNNSGNGGCAETSHRAGGNGVQYGSLAAVLGLVVARLVRSRRKNAKKA